jgi:hypothetical protein
MINRGSLDGDLDDATCTDSLVVLDFGQPDFVNGTYGTNYWVNYAPGYQFVSDLEVIAAVQSYAYGWYTSTGVCPRLHLVVGTNNDNQLSSGGGTLTEAGSAWADVVDAVQDYLVSNGYDWQITAWAGDDIEAEWDCAGPTKEFLDGYAENPSANLLLDYGTAWGDPCWSSADLHYAAYSPGLRYPVPEIYFGTATDSWVSLRESEGFMPFSGVMTTCQQGDPLPSIYCTTPSGGWFAPSAAQWDLYNKLDANGVGQGYFGYSTNIRWQ